MCIKRPRSGAGSPTPQQPPRAAMPPAGLRARRIERICDLCAGLSWFNLDSESHGANAHHKSRKALESSAEKCPLCRLVLRAAITNHEGSNGMKPGDGHWREYVLAKVQDENGVHDMLCVTEFGRNRPENDLSPVFLDFPVGAKFIRDFMGAMPEHLAHSSIRVFNPTLGGVEADQAVPNLAGLTIGDSAENLPVWVYGNYWAVGEPKFQGDRSHIRLVGIGARFGTSPRPVDTIGSEPGELNLRGSAIRICTTDGR